jgi:hypothetical protein
MKSMLKQTFLFGIIITLFSCGNSEKESASLESTIATDSIGNQLISSSAALDNKKDSARKFIRTADLKFKVKDVKTATNEIENICRDFDGFVIYSKLNSTINNSSTLQISADSSLETTYFSVGNNMTIRIPTTYLDTVLRSFAHLAVFLDYRIIKADDVSLTLLANKMSEDRSANTAHRLLSDIDKNGKKLHETTNAEELLLKTKQETDNATISSLSIDDQIKYSTINIEIYQRQITQREVIANDKNLEAYEPGLMSKIADSIKAGWVTLETLFIGILRLWGLIIIIILGYFIFVGIRRRKEK